MIAAALAAVPAAAQVPGLPVYNQGVPRGIGLYGDVGFPNDVAGRRHRVRRDRPCRVRVRRRHRDRVDVQS